MGAGTETRAERAHARAFAAVVSMSRGRAWGGGRKRGEGALACPAQTFSPSPTQITIIRRSVGRFGSRSRATSPPAPARVRPSMVATGAAAAAATRAGKIVSRARARVFAWRAPTGTKARARAATPPCTVGERERESTLRRFPHAAGADRRRGPGRRGGSLAGRRSGRQASPWPAGLASNQLTTSKQVAGLARRRACCAGRPQRHARATRARGQPTDRLEVEEEESTTQRVPRARAPAPRLLRGGATGKGRTQGVPHDASRTDHQAQ